jgi:hypothetical protein
MKESLVGEALRRLGIAPAHLHHHHINVLVHINPEMLALRPLD